MFRRQAPGFDCEEAISMRRVVGILGIAMAGAVVVGGAAPPAVAGMNGDRFQVVSRPWTEHYTNADPQGESVGDTFTFTEKLFHNGDRVGRDAGSCKVTRVTKRAYGLHCTVTLTFRGKGDIAVQGAITYKRGQRSRPTLAITGGTGDYADAAGVVKLVDRRGEPFRLRVRLR